MTIDPKNLSLEELREMVNDYVQDLEDSASDLGDIMNSCNFTESSLERAGDKLCTARERLDRAIDLVFERLKG